MPVNREPSRVPEGFLAESVVAERGAAFAAAVGSATGGCGCLSSSPIPTPGAGCALSSATKQLGVSVHTALFSPDFSRQIEVLTLPVPA